MDGIQAAQKSARDAAGQWMYGQPENADAAYKHGTLVALIAIAEELREIRKAIHYYVEEQTGLPQWPPSHFRDRSYKEKKRWEQSN